jgi:hypothetical protein
VHGKKKRDAKHFTIPRPPPGVAAAGGAYSETSVDANYTRLSDRGYSKKYPLEGFF